VAGGDRVTFGFDATLPIEIAPTPPSAWYTSPEMLERETATLFRESWLFVARVDELKNPGDFVSGRFLDAPWVLTRGYDGELRAFFNVCRHHAAEVATGSGCSPTLTCPYHGWRYALDGRLESAPRLGPAREFNREIYGLVPMPVTTLGPFVGVQIAPPDYAASNPPVLSCQVQPMLESTGYEDLIWFKREQYDMDCNWKVTVDNYLDGGYHVPVLHHGLADQLSLGDYETEVGDGYVVQRCQSDPDSTSRMGAEALYIWLSPTFAINRYGPYMDTNLIVPLSVDKTRVIFDYYAEPSALADAQAIDQTLRTSAQVQEEDGSICESVQRGIASPAYETGRYAPRLEHGAYAFHRWVSEALERSKSPVPTTP
jgi:choline monooxygenase